MSSTENATKSASNILDLDRQYLWHPYSSTTNKSPLFSVARAEGVKLYLENGSVLIDGMSSWWSAIHGYNHPKLNQAAYKQIEQFSHVMFGGLTHNAAATLGEKLVSITPKGLDRVFLSDSGSVSVEVAMKMATQYWIAKQRPSKKRFLTVRNGYHGDTFAAMSVTDPVNGMHHLFKDAIAQQLFAPAPCSRFENEYQRSELNEFETLLRENKAQIAAVIIEPIVQGAGGMRMYHAAYLSDLAKLCEQHEVLLIADEIATGFGRTGKLFACEHSGVTPDILCLGKALTGGYLSLAATICSDEIAHTISSNEPGVFMHGPTFMGNPLACAIANASIDELMASPWQARINTIEKQLQQALLPLKTFAAVKDVRCLGAIGVIELENQPDFNRIQNRLVELGVWLRPYGKLIYTMPPFIINEEELFKITDAMKILIEEITQDQS